MLFYHSNKIFWKLPGAGFSTLEPGGGGLLIGSLAEADFGGLSFARGEFFFFAANDFFVGRALPFFAEFCLA